MGRVAPIVRRPVERVVELARAHPGTVVAGQIVVLAALTGALGWMAYPALFSWLPPWDDDGYLLATIAAFTQGGDLYDEVASQYGPGVFAVVGNLLDLLGVPFTSDGARFVNLALWLGTALGVGLAVLRLTRSLAIAATALVVAFVVLEVDGDEPLHPGAAIAFALVLIAVASAWLGPRRPNLALAVIGALAALVFTFKLNVGGLLFIAVAWVLAVAGPIRSRLLVGAASALLVATPVALVAGNLEHPQAARHAVAVGGGAIALAFVVLARQGLQRFGWGAVRAFAGCAAATLVAVAALVLLAGTSVSGFLEGWFVEPAQMPQLAYLPLNLGEWSPAWALLGVGGAIVAALATRAGSPSTRARAVSGCARVGIGLLVWLAAIEPVLGPGVDRSTGIAVGSAFAWLAAVAPPGSTFGDLRFRLVIAATALLQSLHAFPVAGSQVGWACLLFVVTGALIVADGVDDLAAVARARRPLSAWRGLVAGAVVAFGVWTAAGPLSSLSQGYRDAYDGGVSPGLPGTERLRVPPDRALALAALVHELDRRCSAFLTVPGLNSLYSYAGRQPPEVLNGPWWLFFDAQEQRRVIEEVAGEADLCVVRNSEMIGFWQRVTGTSGTPDGPLWSYIDDGFRPTRSFGSYELLTPASPPR